MKEISILITTFNRPESLLNLLKQIKKEAEGFNVSLIILNDHSTKDYSEPYQFLGEAFPGNYDLYETDFNMGKRRYWQLINFGFRLLEDHSFDYFVQLPDDIHLVKGFFKKSVEQWEAIQDHNKACLNILQDQAREMVVQWVNFRPYRITFNSFGYIRTGWVDMCFISGQDFFRWLNYEIHQVPDSFAGDPSRSSGVGMQISRRLAKLKKSIYQVEKSLVIHDDHPSVMHPDHRKKIQLITDYEIEINEPVIATMATIPSRIQSLQETVNSILPQVDELWIYLNDFSQVPEFLNHPKIKTFRSQDHMDDLGDAGKFYQVPAAGYHFTIDDDLIYHSDYVQKMVKGIEKYKRKAVISLHGRRFDLLPVKSYYHGHSSAFSCLMACKKDEPIHVCGTGVLAYHTSTIQVDIADFMAANMADIWFSKRCQEKGIPRIVLNHPEGFIKHSTQVNLKETIYKEHHRKDKLQTSITNQVQWDDLVNVL